MAQIAWARTLGRVAFRVPNLDMLTVLPLLTVVLLLLRAPQAWYLQVPLTLLCVIGLVFRGVTRSSPFWYLAATMVGATVYMNWASADNHKYLICYWCLALCCVFSLPLIRQRQALAITSRWLIGLCMVWAVLWKAFNPQYMDGSFFHFTLLADERFANFARIFSGLGSLTFTDNRHLYELLVAGHLRGVAVASVTLADNNGVRWLAQFLTWWTILIEFGLAVAFLLPSGKRTTAVRNSLLLGFGVTTYAVAPVVGFGWMLMLLGMAQCDRDDRWLKLAYLGVFMLILVYAIPFMSIASIVSEHVR